MKTKFENRKPQNCPLPPCTGIENYFAINSFSIANETKKS